jgi:hypothetical protein
LYNTTPLISEPYGNLETFYFLAYSLLVCILNISEQTHTIASLGFLASKNNLYTSIDWQ